MLRATLAALLLAAAPALAQEAHIEVLDAYAIATTPQATAGAAYMVIQNHGAAADRLLSVASPAAERVELHSSSQDESGVMRMEPIEDGLELPAGGEVPLERGGNHLMFMGLTEPWEDGKQIPVTLTFEQAGEVTVDVPVDLSRLTDGGGMDHGSMDHGDMEGMDE